MKIYTKEYFAQIPLLRRFLKNKPNQNRVDTAAEFAASSGTPLLIVLSLIASIEGVTEEIKKKIWEIMRFYEVSEIVEEML